MSAHINTEKGGRKLKHTAVRIDEATHKAIVKLAKQEDRSVSNMINVLLKEALKRRGWK